MNKINKVIKFEDLPDDALEAFDEEYPDGCQDYIRKITKPNGSTFYAFNLDTETISYLVKVEVTVDSSGEIEMLDEELIDKKAERAAKRHSKEESDLDEEEDD